VSCEGDEMWSMILLMSRLPGGHSNACGDRKSSATNSYRRLVSTKYGVDRRHVRMGQESPRIDMGLVSLYRLGRVDRFHLCILHCKDFGCPDFVYPDFFGTPFNISCTEMQINCLNNCPWLDFRLTGANSPM